MKKIVTFISAATVAALGLVILATPSSAANPLPPTNPTYSVTATTVTLNWDAPAGGTQGYQITDPSNTQIGATLATSFDVTGLQPGTTYDFLVYSLDLGFRSATALDFTVTTTALTPLPPRVVNPTPLHAGTLLVALDGYAPGVETVTITGPEISTTPVTIGGSRPYGGEATWTVGTPGVYTLSTATGGSSSVTILPALTPSINAPDTVVGGVATLTFTDFPDTGDLVTITSPSGVVTPDIPVTIVGGVGTLDVPVDETGDWVIDSLTLGAPVILHVIVAPTPDEASPHPTMHYAVEFVNDYCPTGWGVSWQQWANQGRGGAVCVLDVNWDEAAGRYAQSYQQVVSGLLGRP